MPSRLPNKKDFLYCFSSRGFGGGGGFAVFDACSLLMAEARQKKCVKEALQALCIPRLIFPKRKAQELGSWGVGFRVQGLGFCAACFCFARAFEHSTNMVRRVQVPYQDVSGSVHVRSGIPPS